MDDYNLDSLNESRNEWTCRFLDILTPHLNEGIHSIFNEAYVLCKTNEEEEKYLMTFQNLLSRVPSWNQTIIDDECKRIIEKSRCKYLNDLLTCIHIIQLKVLTNVRVCKNQKQVDIDIPKLESYIHKVYINIARKLYKNIFLFEKDCSPLQKQKNNREFETIIKECILLTIRDNIPIDKILRAYMSEKMEEEVEEVVEVKQTDSSANDVSSKSETTKVDPVKNEPAKADPVKVDPVKVEPLKTEPEKIQPPPIKVDTIETVPSAVPLSVENTDVSDSVSKIESPSEQSQESKTVIDFTASEDPINKLEEVRPRAISFDDKVDEIGLDALELNDFDIDTAPAMSLNE